MSTLLLVLLVVWIVGVPILFVAAVTAMRWLLRDRDSASLAPVTRLHPARHTQPTAAAMLTLRVHR